MDVEKVSLAFEIPYNYNEHIVIDITTFSLKV